MIYSGLGACVLVQAACPGPNLIGPLFTHVPSPNYRLYYIAEYPYIPSIHPHNREAVYSVYEYFPGALLNLISDDPSVSSF